MNVGLSLSQTVSQTLTPQQVQYLKLLQLNSLQLEQYIRQELESNPMLDETEDDNSAEFASESEQLPDEPLLPREETTSEERTTDDDTFSEPEPRTETLADIDPNNADDENERSWQDYIEDDDIAPLRKDIDSDEETPVRSVNSFVEDLLEQFYMLNNLTEEDKLIGEEILWSVEPSGYLLAPLDDVIDQTNEVIDRRNRELTTELLADYKKKLASGELDFEEEDFEDELASGEIDIVDVLAERAGVYFLDPISREQAERILSKIQHLDPPGIGARNLQECLVVQLKALPKLNGAQKLALMVLEECFEHFRMKHYNLIIKDLDVEESYLRDAIEVIKSLNPKPGGGPLTMEMQSVIPDFFVVPKEETNDFIVHINDGRMPALSINREYERMRKEARKLNFNRDTRDWLKKKHEDAKFLIQAVAQRRETMRKVITSIVVRQRDFFRVGEDGLKPLIYKDVAEDTLLDISTVCRVVNGKYVQTQFGVFELRYFFSESLESTDGDEISTKVIKNKLRELIERESKKKPLSDDKLAKDMKKLGYEIARRTVAKYREQMNIPVARLRKEL